MKKTIILSILVSSLFVGVANASSTVTCGDPALNRPETVLPSGEVLPAINNVRCDGTNPENVASAWGTNSSVPSMTSGQLAIDEGGIKSICPMFISRCVDITHTNYYRTQMKELGRQLKSLGVTGGLFSYWINQ